MSVQWQLVLLKPKSCEACGDPAKTGSDLCAGCELMRDVFRKMEPQPAERGFPGWWIVALIPGVCVLVCWIYLRWPR